MENDGLGIFKGVEFDPLWTVDAFVALAGDILDYVWHLWGATVFDGLAYILFMFLDG